ncbi:hypothetical protein LPQ03_27660, partial [Klebsiella pneumoniae]|nr:hypothetical protein [Klebsiella pneumoniae]MCJ3131150.1 hypothetical protein [Klebsiella pneumoniae]MCJ3136751.1 hypothetical protein [Klebsiella pneumoniae]MCJ3148114.1 hypothetical protein [Klebsiella pneumoniae]MCJ3164371.1 hypothetical protein [Klebsiella pneumoniae]
MMSLWDALRMNMMISYQELVRTFLSSTEVPPGAPSGDYLMLETSAYIFAMKQPRGYTYIGLVKNLINEGEGHIWWKI